MSQLASASEIVATKSDFWRRQWFGPKTMGSSIVDVTYGILLPLLCYWFDPQFLWGGGPGEAPLAAHLIGALSMLGMATWVAIGGWRSDVDAVLAGILLAGGVLGSTIALMVLTLAFFGNTILVVVLGSIPLGTAFVFFRAGTRALGPINAFRVRTVAAIFLCVAGLGFGYQAAADWMIDQSVREITESRDPGTIERAIARLERWRPLVPRREFVRRASQFRAHGDLDRADYDTAYRLLTGRSIREERVFQD